MASQRSPTTPQMSAGSICSQRRQHLRGPWISHEVNKVHKTYTPNLLPFSTILSNKHIQLSVVPHSFLFPSTLCTDHFGPSPSIQPPTRPSFPPHDKRWYRLSAPRGLICLTKSFPSHPLFIAFSPSSRLPECVNSNCLKSLITRTSLSANLFRINQRRFEVFIKAATVSV